MAISTEIHCPQCDEIVDSEEDICPYCGASTRAGEITETLHDRIGFETAALHARRIRESVVLQPREIALYIEDASTPLIADLSNRVTIGRHSARDINVAPTISLTSYDAFSRGISRVHATLYYDTARAMVMIVDEYSTNGTWLNGRRLEPMAPTPVQNNDELRLSRLRIVVITPTPPTSTSYDT